MELGNVFKVLAGDGYSRDTFDRYLSAVAEGGMEALLERTSPDMANMANRVFETME